MPDPLKSASLSEVPPLSGTMPRNPVGPDFEPLHMEFGALSEQVWTADEGRGERVWRSERYEPGTSRRRAGVEQGEHCHPAVQLPGRCRFGRSSVVDDYRRVRCGQANPVDASYFCVIDEPAHRIGSTVVGDV